MHLKIVLVRDLLQYDVNDYIENTIWIHPVYLPSLSVK